MWPVWQVPRTHKWLFIAFACAVYKIYFVLLLYFCLPPVTEEEGSGISHGFALRIFTKYFHQLLHVSVCTYWFSVLGPFINRRNANTFISPQQRWRAKAQERYVPQLDGGSSAIAQIWTEWERGLSLFLCLELKEWKSKTEKTECLETSLLWG